MKVYLSKAIHIEGKNWKITCDSTNSNYYPLSFISHAHSDHIPKKLPKTNIITSNITKLLLKNIVSNFDDAKYHDNYKQEDVIFNQISSGHIIGSTALVADSAEGKLVYTGDVSIRDKGFLRPFEPMKCDTLIIESTFGSPEFEFPLYNEVIEQTKDEIFNYLNKDIPIVLMGYALGKAQMLYHAFGNLSETKILHGSNFRINTVLESERIDGYIDAVTYQEAKERNILDKESNWILFAPLKSGRDKFYSYLKKKYGVKLFAFSGWGISQNYRYRMGIDHSVPISDHADFSELIEICEKSEPNQIFTVYGYTTRFAAELRKRGFTAYPLSKQTILDSYFS
jgi:putative mRNA 3-end processing factor